MHAKGRGRGRSAGRLHDNLAPRVLNNCEGADKGMAAGSWQLLSPLPQHFRTSIPPRTPVGASHARWMRAKSELLWEKVDHAGAIITLAATLPSPPRRPIA